MTGFLEPVWETVFRIATWSALIFGALSIGSAFVSAWVGWEITDATQKDADKKIKAADERIAEFNTRTKEAELKLELLRERMKPREIKGESFLKILEGAPKAPVEIVFVRDDPECFQLAMQIRNWLKTAKWQVSEPAAITDPDEPRMSQYPSAMRAGGQPSGVTIVQRVETPEDFERARKMDPFGQSPPATADEALSRALMDSIGTVAGGMSWTIGTVGILRVVVGSKSQQ